MSALASLWTIVAKASLMASGVPASTRCNRTPEGARLLLKGAGDLGGARVRRIGEDGHLGDRGRGLLEHLQADLPPTILVELSENERISLFFVSLCSHVNRQFLL